MLSKAKTVAEYLASLPADRRAAIATMRETILANIDRTFEEGMQYGMIGYYVPHRVFPAGYHCDPKQPLPFTCLASQKNHMSLSVMALYKGGDLEAWFRKAWVATGKKLDMGACCIRFKKVDDVPLDLVAQLLRKVSAKDYIANYERTLAGMKSGAKAGSKPKATKKPVKKSAAPKAKAKATAKKPAAKR
jgi:Domain of unknown function (DU1801)